MLFASPVATSCRPVARPQQIVATTAPSFESDSKVVSSASIDTLYYVEYRGHPNYRIVSFDPKTGVQKSIFTVPENGFVYAIALSPDRKKLLVSLAKNIHEKGNGVYLLDLSETAPMLQEVIPQVVDVHLVDLVWGAASNRIWSTRGVSNRLKTKFSVAQIDLETRTVRDVIANAINPAPFGDSIAYLPLEADLSRRKIGVFDTQSKTNHDLGVFEGAYDLGNLIHDPHSGRLRVSAIERKSAALQFGTIAYAHGNHNVDAIWIAVEPVSGNVVKDTQAPATIYDAQFSANGELIEVTSEGLALSKPGDQRKLLVKSRTFRHIAY
jgi:hypothetical protein